jgi:hypothetical protein
VWGPVQEGATALAWEVAERRSVDRINVIPCFRFRFFGSAGRSRDGVRLATGNGREIVNYPLQQLQLGHVKNQRTGGGYRAIIRELKCSRDSLAASGQPPLPSYLLECLAYNCSEEILTRAVPAAVLTHLRERVLEPEITAEWLEANDCFYLFHPGRTWTAAEVQAFAEAALDDFGATQEPKKSTRRVGE